MEQENTTFANLDAEQRSAAVQKLIERVNRRRSGHLSEARACLGSLLSFRSLFSLCFSLPSALPYREELQNNPYVHVVAGKSSAISVAIHEKQYHHSIYIFLLPSFFPEWLLQGILEHLRASSPSSSADSVASSSSSEAPSREFKEEEESKEELFLDRGSPVDLVWLGCGSLSSPTALAQLTVLLVLERKLLSRVTVASQQKQEQEKEEPTKLPSVRLSAYDPVLTSLEQQTLIQGFDLNYLATNDEGRVAVQQDACLTLFYLPHCCGELYSNLIWRNWGWDLGRLLLFGNHLDRYSPPVDLEFVSRNVLPSAPGDDAGKARKPLLQAGQSGAFGSVLTGSSVCQEQPHLAKNRRDPSDRTERSSREWRPVLDDGDQRIGMISADMADPALLSLAAVLPFSEFRALEPELQVSSPKARAEDRFPAHEQKIQGACGTPEQLREIYTAFNDTALHRFALPELLWPRRPKLQTPNGSSSSSGAESQTSPLLRSGFASSALE